MIYLISFNRRRGVMCIGEKISELRKLNKLTQRDLAEKLNVSDKVISK